MNKNRPFSQNPSTAEYQRHYAAMKKAKKAARYKNLLKMAEPLKEALKKYRPENQPPTRPPEKQPPPPPRKRWILGLD